MKNSISFESSLSKFGIGLFETIRVDEKPIDLDLHMDRMFNSIELLNMNINYERKILEDKILDYIKKNKIHNKALRITVFDEGYNISIRDIVYNEKSYKNGFKLNISSIRRGDSIINRHKTTNYFENIYTKNYAIKNKFDDGIFLDTNGIILECSMSNIFFIKDKKIFTPSSELPILNGIMRSKIIAKCNDLEIDLIEKKINISEIKDFDFVFLSNSLMKIMKVTQIEEIVYDKENEIFDKIIDYL